MNIMYEIRRFVIFWFISLVLLIVDSLKYLIEGRKGIVRIGIFTIYIGIAYLMIMSSELFNIAIVVLLFIDGLSTADYLYGDLI